MAAGRHDQARPDRLNPLPLLLAAGVATFAAAAGVLPRWPGALHFVALPPLDLMADVRALLVYAPNVPVFVLGTGLAVAARSALLAWMLGPLTRRRFLYALRFYLIVVPFAGLAAAMFHATGAVLYYGLFWFGLIVTLLILTLTAAAVWMDPPQLRSGFKLAFRHGLRAGTLGAYLLMLTALGYLADVTAPWGPAVLVILSAGATYLAAQMLYADPGFRLLRRGLAALPAAGILALVLVVQQGPTEPPSADLPTDPNPGSIMLMSGIDSRSGSGAILELNPHFMGWACEQTFYYSYAGPGNGQPQREAFCEITHGTPYEREDTLRSTEELVPFLEAQTAEMPAPGVVAGHSQGVWLVWEAAADDRLPNVERIVLVGAFPHNPIPYLHWDERGQGRMSRLTVSLVEGIGRPGGTSVFRADSPLGREWLGHPSAVTETLERPLPDQISALSVTSVFDLPLMKHGYRIDGATDACPVPVLHPDLPYSPEFQQHVQRFATGQPPDDHCPFWRTSIGPLFRHFSAVSP